ncbi:uncharacterized protein LOC135383965 [Ornithodoros turicata]|uniref:uncharacterized protein LOC135383965 n=1 Tax=Ornithodoros turicata TaxID=34597 RepID=UPI003138D574
MTQRLPSVTSAFVFDLIYLVEQNPSLWRFNDEQYRNVPTKQMLWEKISQDMREKHPDVQVTTDIVKALFATKRRQYQDERRTKLTIRTGSEAPVYTGKWQFYSALTFLDQNCSPGPVTITGVQEPRPPQQQQPVSVHVSEQEHSPVFYALESVQPDEEQEERITVQQNTSHREQLNSSPAVAAGSPKPPRQQKRTRCTDDEKCGQQALSEIVAALTAPPPEPDECRSFGEIVECRLRQMPVALRNLAEVRILTLLNDMTS